MLQTAESVTASEVPSTFAMLDYHPEFLESLAESGIQILFDRLGGPEKSLLGACQLVYYLLYRAGRGDVFSDMDLDLLHSSVAEITNLIWQLGGAFYNQNGYTINKEYPGRGSQ